MRAGDGRHNQRAIKNASFKKHDPSLSSPVAAMPFENVDREIICLNANHFFVAQSSRHFDWLPCESSSPVCSARPVCSEGPHSTPVVHCELFKRRKLSRE